MPIIRRRSRKLIFAGLAGAAVTGAVCAGAMLYYVHGSKEQRHVERTNTSSESQSLKRPSCSSSVRCRQHGSR